MNSVKTTGRLRYVEPTIIGNKTSDLSDSINFPYEDYNMSVDLSVRITDRYSCGWGNYSGENNEIHFSSKNGSISFLKGSQIPNSGDDTYLTTNFTDISMTSPSTNTSECLGIESISITYGQWMFPQVVIKFIDVRGASVMMPSEHNYYNKTQAGNTSSLYKALFTFPYPMFMLKVKGFYGKGVTYKLAVQKTDLEFDNESGNFNIVVTFIGYMYGVYADMPLTYLAAAPYMVEGSKYWEEKKNDGTFSFRDSSGQPRYEMITIPELRLRLAKAANSREAISAATEKQKVINNTNDRLSKLDDIHSTFPFKNWKYIDKTYYLSTNNLNVLNETRVKIDNFISNYESYEKTYKNNIPNKFKILKKTIEKYSATELGYTSDNTTVFYVTDYKHKPGEYKIPNEKLYYTNSNNVFREGENIIEIPDSLKEYAKQNPFLIHINVDDDYLDIINNESEKKLIKNESKKLERKYKKEEEAAIEKILGFKPSIRNIFNLIFAHMETFMHCFYSNTNIIKQELKSNSDIRKKSTYGVTGENSDTEEYISSTNSKILNLRQFLPPYFALYTKNEETGLPTFTYPGHLEGGNNLSEVNFVEDLLAGAHLYNKESNLIDEKISKLDFSGVNNLANNFVGAPKVDTSSFIPVTYYDFVFKDEINNPYNKIKYDIINGKSNVKEDVLRTFLLRSYYYHLYSNLFGENINEAHAFGVLESINFYKAIGEITTSPDFDNFLNECGNENHENILKDFIAEYQLSNGNNGIKNLFTVNNNTVKYVYNDFLPIGVFNEAQIKDDNLYPGNLIQNSSYISIESGVSENSFFVIDSNDYIEKIYNNINNELNGNTEAYDVFRKKRVYRAFSNNINSDVDYNPFKCQTTTNGLDNVIVDIKGNNVDLKERYKALYNGKETWSEYYVKFPTIVGYSGKDVKTSLFGTDFYKQQENIFAKAFLFLQSLPIWGETMSISKNLDNGVHMKALLLREGSYYWWKENYNNDKLFNFSNIKKTEINESFYVDGIYSPIKIGDNNSEYEQWDVPRNVTNSGMLVLKKMFEDWVENDFKYYERLLNDKNYYNDNLYNLGLKLPSDILIDNTELHDFLKDLFFVTQTTIELKPKRNDGVSLSVILNTFKSFIMQLRKTYTGRLKELKNDPQGVIDRRLQEQANNPFVNQDIRTSTYMTLKSLYDKWLCSPEKGPEQTWSFKSNVSDFNNFIYVDSFYHDIGDKLTVNVNKVSSWLSSCLPTSNINTTDGLMGYAGKSIYEFLTTVAQDSGGMLLALPHKIGAYTTNSVAEMFTPMPLYSNWDDDTSTFVFMYTYKPSEHLGDNETSKYDMNGWNRKGDGIDLTDDELVGRVMGDDNGYVVPAFGVTFAKQNQSLFKNIRLNTENNGVTEASLAATFNIASTASSSPRETIPYGQDLYRLFSQYSYTCSAECMGNMQITPLMYFQLNNIPLWKGGYQILRVNHEITAGNISTKFEGVRINRYAIPFTNNIINLTMDEFDDYNDNNLIKTIPMDSPLYNSYDLNVITGETRADTLANPNVIGNMGDIEFNEFNVSEKKPIICITPAHGPKTKKKEEWAWSNKVVSKIKEILTNNVDEYQFYDGTPMYYNLQECNKNGYGSDYTGYSLKQVEKLIKKYGSKQVLSVVPHWNGGGGNYHWTMVDKASNGVRPDSMKLAECMRNEFSKIQESYKDTSLYPMFKGGCRIENEDETTTDMGPRVNCACVLTENWFADFKGVDSKSWLNSDEGIEKIAKAHVDAIKKYIEQL